MLSLTALTLSPHATFAQALPGLLTVAPQSSVMMGVPSITPSGNEVFNDAAFTFTGSDGEENTVVLTTGSVIYVGPTQTPHRVLWAESTSMISAEPPTDDDGGDAETGPGPQVTRWV